MTRTRHTPDADGGAGAASLGEHAELVAVLLDQVKAAQAAAKARAAEAAKETR